MSQDTLSDVLRGVRLRGAVFFYVTGSSEWAAEAPSAKEIAPLLMRGVEHAGADCLYAPGIAAPDQIAAVVAALAPKPINLLVGSASKLTLDEISALGVRRVSVGGALARSAWGGFMRAARLIAEHGKFDEFANAASGRELNAFFAADSKKEAHR